MSLLKIGILLLVSCIFHQPLTAQKKISIDTFTDLITAKFQSNEKILASDAEEGIKVDVAKSLNLDSLSVLKGNGKFQMLQVAASDAKFHSYQLPIIKGIDTIHLQMFRNESQKNIVKIILLIVDRGNESESNGQVLVPLKDCKDDISLSPVGNCQPATLENNFGESAEYYTKNTVTYLYDFNSDPLKRIIYKFILNHGVLKKTVANMSTEVLKPNQQVYFKVVNINQFLFDVTLSDTTISYYSEPSALFNRLFLGDSTILGGLLSTFSSNNVAAHSSKSTGDNLDRLAENIKCFFKKYNRLQGKMIEAYNPCTNFPCCFGNGEEYYQLANDLLDIKLYMAVVFQNLIKQQQEKLDKASEKVKTCETLKGKLEANGKDRKPIEDQQEDKRSKEDKDKLVTLLKQKSEIEKQYENCSDPELKKAKDEIAKLEADIKYYGAINDLQTKMLPSEADLKKLIIFLKNMVRQQNTFVSGPIALDGNRLDLRLNIHSKDSITKYFSTNYYNKTMNYQIPVKAKGFVSFSAGSFIGVHRHLKNIRYEWQQIPNQANTVLDTAKNILVESGYTAPPVGFAALGNVEWQSGRKVGFGLSGGVGITIEIKPRPAYLLGASIFFGEVRQFVFTGGFTALQVDRINTNLQAVAQQRVIYTTKAQLDYYKEFKIGTFISLTYTPFTIRRNK